MMRTTCRHDLRTFAKYYFPNVCRLEWSGLHRYLIGRREAKTAEPIPKRRGSMDVVLAPRGAAKSTLVSLVFPVHALLYRVEAYIVLISATQRQAEGRLGNIRDALAGNERLQNDFKEELGGRRRRSRTILQAGGVKIEALSAGSEFRGLTFGGWRPTWIVLDDVEAGGRVFNSAYRDGLHEWMKEVIENLGNGYTNIDLIGTKLHPDSLPARLAERPDVRARTFRSIVSEARRSDLWEAWQARLFDLANPGRMEDARRFFEERREEMLDGAKVLWPEKESYYDLQVMRATRGPSSFDKEKQNQPRDDGACVFGPGALRRFSFAGRRVVLAGSPGWDAEVRPPEVALGSMRVFGFLDPAIGEARGTGRERSGDFAAIATVGIDQHGYLYVLDVWLERAAPSVQIPKIFELHDRWGYIEFGVETNAFQKFLLDPLERERERRRRAGQSPGPPVRGVRHRTSKRLRIVGLEPLARSGWLLFNEALPEVFWRQLADFPHARHDDGPDALAAAVALARGSQAKIEPDSARRSRVRRPLRSY